MSKILKVSIIGAIWGILSIIPYSYISENDTLIRKGLLILFGFPTYIAITLNFHFQLIFIVAPIIGMIITSTIYYLIKGGIR